MFLAGFNVMKEESRLSFSLYIPSILHIHTSTLRYTIKRNLDHHIFREKYRPTHLYSTRKTHPTTWQKVSKSIWSRATWHDRFRYIGASPVSTEMLRLPPQPTRTFKLTISTQKFQTFVRARTWREGYRRWKLQLRSKGMSLSDRLGTALTSRILRS